MRGASLRERFNAKYKIASNGCWLWTACADRDGYGFIRHQGKNLKAHRVSFELSRNVQLQQGQFVCHSCDTPACVNPSHLWLGDQALNQIDSANKGRHGHQKIVRAQAIEIRKRYLSGESPLLLSKEFGICEGYVINVGKRRKWAHAD